MQKLIAKMTLVLQKWKLKTERCGRKQKTFPPMEQRKAKLVRRTKKRLQLLVKTIIIRTCQCVAKLSLTNPCKVPLEEKTAGVEEVFR